MRTLYFIGVALALAACGAAYGFAGSMLLVWVEIQK